MSRRRKRWIALVLVAVLLAPIATGFYLNHQKKKILDRLAADGVQANLSPLILQRTWPLLSSVGISVRELPVLFWNPDEIIFAGEPISPKKMERIVTQANRLGTIRSVDLSWRAEYLDARALPSLAKLQRLESLNLSGCELTDDDMKLVGQIAPIRSLCLDDNRVTTKGLAELSALPRLERLSFVRTQVRGSEVIDELQSMPHLKAMRLGGDSATTDEDLTTLRNAL